MPINSAIGFPTEAAQLSGPSVEIKGWAHGEGSAGTQATGVELSFDGGHSWQKADELVMEDKPEGQKVFSWTLWKYKLNTSAMRGTVSVLVRATDSKGDLQTGTLDELYNLRGILNSAPHEVTFQVNQ